MDGSSGARPRSLRSQIDDPKEVEQLLADRRVWFKSDGLELFGELLRRQTASRCRKIVGEFPIVSSFDLDANPQLRIFHRRRIRGFLAHEPALLHGNRIAAVTDRQTSSVTDARLLLEKIVVAVRGQQDKESPMSQVVDVRQASHFASGPTRTRTIDPVLFDQLVIHNRKPLAFGNMPRHQKPVAMCHRQLKQGHLEALQRVLGADKHQPVSRPKSSQWNAHKYGFLFSVLLMTPLKAVAQFGRHNAQF